MGRDDGQLYAMFEGQRGMGVISTDTVEDPMVLLRGEVTPSAPLVFRHNIGRVPRDLMMAGDVSILLISDHLRSILAHHGFTGWSTYAVDVRSKLDERIPSYSGLVITGRSQPTGTVALARHRAEELVRRTRSSDDFYLDGGSALIVVTGRVRDAMRAGRVTNVAFMPVG